MVELTAAMMACWLVAMKVAGKAEMTADQRVA